jgi:hypothetical protein
VVQEHLVQFFQKREELGLDLKVDSQSVALQGKGQEVVIFRPEQLQHHQEGPEARGADAPQNLGQALKACGLGEHQLILGKPTAAVHAVPVADPVQRKEKIFQRRKAVRHQIWFTVAIQLVEAGHRVFAQHKNRQFQGYALGPGWRQAQRPGLGEPA